jgi:hypothetical protein
MPRHYQKEQEKCRQEEISPQAGARGYETAIPKWDKKEQEMIAKGITPEPIRDEWEMSGKLVPCAWWFVR